jgi:hypothetical protein
VDLAILLAAVVAAASSLFGVVLQRRSDRRVQQAEHDHADDARLYDRRIDLYTKLQAVLRGSEREFQQRRIADYDDPAQARAWVADLLGDMAGDSTARVTESKALLGHVRLVATDPVVKSAEVCVSKLERLQTGWMQLLLELLKDKSEQDVKGVFERAVIPAQDELTKSIDELEAATRRELRVGA